MFGDGMKIVKGFGVKIKLFGAVSQSRTEIALAFKNSAG